MLSLLVGVAGCASPPWPAGSRPQPARLQAESALPPATDDSSLRQCDWLEAAGRPESPGQPVGMPLGGGDSAALRPLPPIDGDRLDVAAISSHDPIQIADWPARQRPPRPLLRDVRADHANYYTTESFGLLALGMGLASITANTTLDATLHDGYQQNAHSETIHCFKVLGDGYAFLPAFAVAAVAGSWFDDGPVGHGVNEWGNRSLRTVLVGAPPTLAMQWITGGSRPGEIDDASHWRPFEDDNGVSGHAFMGAVPFLSAAKMTDDPLWKAAFYAGSTLAGLSRVNDNRHYPSQAMLGWWMAYVAATAVDRTEQREESLTIFPVPVENGGGIGVEYRR
jgi:membrane-associated phospholipid phosphatase